MNSRTYECHVMHARFIPKPHRFMYRIFMLAIDLDELPTLDRRLTLFSVNRPNLYSFRENDYLPTAEPVYNASASAKPTTSSPPNASASLKARAVAFFARHGIDLGPAGRVELITLPRICGYLFNPVSFYFGYDASGRCLAAICEVTNTFREMKPYFLGPAHLQTDASSNARAAFHLRTPKHFYVSPFSDVDVAFDFRLRPPTNHLSIQIDDYTGPQRTLTSTLSGPSRELNDFILARFTLTYPLLTLRIIALIHWHAAVLYLKKIPWFAKAARPSDQRDLYRPHASLSSTTFTQDT